MAGLWETWVDPAQGDALETCTIITTVANQVVAHYHDRMPVIVPESAFAEWLGDSLDLDRLVRLLRPLEPERMECEPPLTSGGSLELDLG
jgi:putative SOS response-associated peptidase YedK